MAWWCMW